MADEARLRAPNVFLASLLPGEEDRFTSHLAWLLDIEPEVGQAIVDVITAKSGSAGLVFQGAVDHPWEPGFGPENRPDFLFRCQSVDVFSEHKLDAVLGDRQLERYLEVVADREDASALVLIARHATVVPPAVRGARCWLGNRENEEGHFLWSHFYDAVANSPGRAAREFAEYMAVLGMRPVRWGTWGDPFHDVEAREQWRSLWEPVLATLRKPGRVVKRDSQGLGAQIQNPMPGISLLWVGPDDRLQPADGRIHGPVLTIRVYSMADCPDLPAADEEVPIGAEERAFVRASPVPRKLPSGVEARREYFAEFEGFLRDDIEDSRKALSRFIDRCMVHLEGSLAQFARDD